MAGNFSSNSIRVISQVAMIDGVVDSLADLAHSISSRKFEGLNHRFRVISLVFGFERDFEEWKTQGELSETEELVFSMMSNAKVRVGYANDLVCVADLRLIDDYADEAIAHICSSIQLLYQAKNQISRYYYSLANSEESIQGKASVTPQVVQAPKASSGKEIELTAQEHKKVCPKSRKGDTEKVLHSVTPLLNQGK